MENLLNSKGERLIMSHLSSKAMIHWFYNLRLQVADDKEHTFKKYQTIWARTKGDSGMLFHGNLPIGSYQLDHENKIFVARYESKLNTGNGWGNGYTGSDLKFSIPGIVILGDGNAYTVLTIPFLNLSNYANTPKESADESFFASIYDQIYKRMVEYALAFVLTPNSRLYYRGIANVRLESMKHYRQIFNYLLKTGKIKNPDIRQRSEFFYVKDVCSYQIEASPKELVDLMQLEYTDRERLTELMDHVLVRYGYTPKKLTPEQIRDLNFKIWRCDFTKRKNELRSKRTWRDNLSEQVVSTLKFVDTKSAMFKRFVEDETKASEYYETQMIMFSERIDNQNANISKILEQRRVERNLEEAKKLFSKLAAFREGGSLNTYYLGFDLVAPDVDNKFKTSRGIKGIEASTIIKFARVFIRAIENKKFEVSGVFHGYALSGIFKTNGYYISDTKIETREMYVGKIGCHTFTESELMYWLHRHQYDPEIEALYRMGLNLNLAENQQ